MACVHLQQLYQLCQEHHLRLSSSDLVHIVCEQCGKQEVCPSTLLETADSTADPSVEQTTEESPAAGGE